MSYTCLVPLSSQPQLVPIYRPWIYIPRNSLGPTHLTDIQLITPLHCDVQALTANSQYSRHHIGIMLTQQTSVFSLVTVDHDTHRHRHRQTHRHRHSRVTHAHVNVLTHRTAAVSLIMTNTFTYIDTAVSIVRGTSTSPLTQNRKVQHRNMTTTLYYCFVPYSFSSLKSVVA